MLSDDLRVAERYLQEAAKPETLVTKRDLYNVAVLVSCCREMARNMELYSTIAQVPTAADFADGKVVPLPIAGRDVRRMLDGTGPKGGAA